MLGKPEGKKPLERPRRKKEDNIRMDLQELGREWHGLDRAGSAQRGRERALVNAIIVRVP